MVDIGMNADYLPESLASLGACSEEGEAAQIALLGVCRELRACL